MPLTRACLKQPNARSVAGGQGPDAVKLKAFAATHKRTKFPFAEAGNNSTFAGTVLAHTHVTRRSTDEEKIAGLVQLGTINSKTCGSSAGNCF
jgi:hypothetical protein